MSEPTSEGATLPDASGPESKSASDSTLKLPVDSPSSLPAVENKASVAGLSRYSLTRVHAQGGIGRVWLAHDPDLGRDVALKELRPDRGGHAAVWARFVAEAQITGQLEHPGIVPIYELARRPDTHQPFYTMRFIRGRTLSEAVAVYHTKRLGGTESPLELREMLGAFVAVCHAVAYAHSRGVIHRDLKSQNVIVGDFGEVMVVDWGLAKVMGQTSVGPAEPTSGIGPVAVAPDASRQETQEGNILGTPNYMAPEQAEGRMSDVDVRSDVYSLGAILYEILIGDPPFKGSRTLDVLDRVVKEPPMPPRKAVATVAPALEAVCLKALSKRPVDRYGSARDLGQDVQRWLADEPVRAYREPWRVVCRRWLGRHRTAVTAAMAALVVAAVCLGVAAALLFGANRQVQQQRDRARARFQMARDAVDQFHTRVSGSRQLKARGLESLRRDLLTSAVSFYEQLVQEDADDPSLLAERGRAYGRLGDIHRLLGRSAQAEEAYSQAVKLLEPVVAANPQGYDYRLALAENHNNLGLLLSDQDRIAPAEQAFVSAIALLQDLTRDCPAEPRYQEKLGSALNNLALLYRSSSRRKEAEETHQKAIAIQKPLAESRPEDMTYQDGLARSYNNLGNLYRDENQLEKAEKEWRQGLAIKERVTAAVPDDPEYQLSLAMGLENLGVICDELGKSDEAGRLLERSADVGRRLAQTHPEVPAYQMGVAFTYNNLGMHHRDQFRFDLAEQTYRQATPILTALVEQHPEITLGHVALGTIEANLGDLIRDTGRPSAALTCYAQGIDRFEALLKKDSRQRDARAHLLKALGERAVALSQLGRTAEADADLRRAIELDPGSEGDTLRLWGALVRSYAGDHEAAKKEADRQAKLPDPSGRDFWNLAGIYARAADHEKGKTPSESEKDAARAVALLKKADADGYFKNPAAREWLGKSPTFAILQARDDFRRLTGKAR
jgi:serine/threonine-protein kinase